MLIKKFEAPTIRQALQLVKLELGDSAVILSTKTIRTGTGLFGSRTGPIVEVTAAADPSAEETNPRWRPGGRTDYDPRPTSRVSLISGKSSEPEPLIPKRAEAESSPPGDNREESPLPPAPADTGRWEALEREMKELKTMAGFLFHRLGEEIRDRLPEELRFLHVGMTNAGIDDEHALRLLDLLRDRLGEERLPSWETLVPLLYQCLADSALVSAPIETEPGRLKIASFIGPTGAGKTTTVAKLAAQHSMSGGKVALMTIDTYRIAAVEQLNVYARLLEIPLEVIRRPEEIRPALDRQRNRDIILLDTAGRSQRDAQKLKELIDTLTRVEEAEHHLVVPANSDERVMEEIIRSFGNLPVDSLIFTKLDEAVRLGPLYNQSMKFGLPVSYLTTGQNVPEDIEPASGMELARRILDRGFPRNRAHTSTHGKTT